MTDDEMRSGGTGDASKPRHSTVETWYAVIEFVSWMLEPLFWLVRMIVAGIVALLHGCS